MAHSQPPSKFPACVWHPGSLGFRDPRHLRGIAFFTGWADGLRLMPLSSMHPLLKRVDFTIRSDILVPAEIPPSDIELYHLISAEDALRRDFHAPAPDQKPRSSHHGIGRVPEAPGD